MEQRKRPNIIIFNPDQWRGKDVGCLGNPVIRTPNTDQLAREGVAFSNCFAQSTVCTPSRCSFMTGQYPHVSGHRTMNHMLSPQEPFLLKQLMEQGYYVWWGGKNDVVRLEEQEQVCSYRYRPKQGSFHTAQKTIREPGDRLFYSHYQGKLADRTVVSKDDALVNGAIEFLHSNPPEPFCICLTLSAPHVPFQVDEPYYSLYDRGKLPPILPQPQKGAKSRHLELIRERAGWGALTEEDFQEILAVYYGMITKVDDALGRLIEAMKMRGCWDDSAVFVFSDHGEFAGDYGLVEKAQNSFEDDLTKVPLVIKYPSWISIPERSEPISALVELVDFHTTVSDLAQLPQKHTSFGKSLVPLSKGEVDRHREQVFCEGGALVHEPHTHEPPIGRDQVYWPRLSVQNEYPETHGKGVMVRTHRWKFVKRLYESDELYDLIQDPGEVNNVAADRKHVDVCREMSNRILMWYMETCDAVPYRLDPRG